MAKSWQLNLNDCSNTNKKLGKVFLLEHRVLLWVKSYISELAKCSTIRQRTAKQSMSVKSTAAAAALAHMHTHARTHARTHTHTHAVAHMIRAMHRQWHVMKKQCAVGIWKSQLKSTSVGFRFSPFQIRSIRMRWICHAITACSAEYSPMTLTSKHGLETDCQNEPTRQASFTSQTHTPLYWLLNLGH